MDEPNDTDTKKDSQAHNADIVSEWQQIKKRFRKKITNARESAIKRHAKGAPLRLDTDESEQINGIDETANGNPEAREPKGKFARALYRRRSGDRTLTQDGDIRGANVLNDNVYKGKDNIYKGTNSTRFPGTNKTSFPGTNKTSFPGTNKTSFPSHVKQAVPEAVAVDGKIIETSQQSPGLFLPEKFEDKESGLSLEDGPEVNAITLLKQITSGDITGKDLPIVERRLLVQFLKIEGGKTQDQISEVLKVSRRTVVGDFKALRENTALQMEKLNNTELGGELYEVAMSSLRKAYSKGQFKTVTQIIKDMVEMLQSLGLMYRAPLTSKQMQLRATTQLSQNGYANYKDGISGELPQVIEALTEMVSSLSEV